MGQIFSEVNHYGKLKHKWVSQRLEREKYSKKMMIAASLKGKPVFEKYHIHKVILFGSVVAGNSSISSDIDMLVFALPKDQFWKCRHELEQAIEYPIDLYSQDDDPKLIEKIISRGEIIYEV